MKSMEAQVGKLEGRLEHWGARLDELVAKAEAVGAEAKVEYRERVDELKAQYKVSQAKLDELRAATAESWQSFKSGAERAFSEFEHAFKKLKARDTAATVPEMVAAPTSTPRTPP